MEKIAEKIPDFCKAEFDELAKVNAIEAFQIGPETKIVKVRGVQLQNNYPVAALDYAYDNWAPLTGDVLIASYPRTGKKIIQINTFPRESEVPAVYSSQHRDFYAKKSKSVRRNLRRVKGVKEL